MGVISSADKDWGQIVCSHFVMVCGRLYVFGLRKYALMMHTGIKSRHLFVSDIGAYQYYFSATGGHCYGGRKVTITKTYQVPDAVC